MRLKDRLASVSLDLGLHENLLRLKSQLECFLPAGGDASDYSGDDGDDHNCSHGEFVSETLQQKASYGTSEERDQAVANRSLDHDGVRSLFETFRGLQQYILVVFHGAAALYTPPGEVSTA